MKAFWKKEWLAQLRTGKLLILLLLFTAFGIMNPAVAKLTPWLLETMGDSLASSGLIVTQVEITAMDAWAQFFKNIPMALIVFVVLQGGILTEECRSGSLVLSLSKGVKRWQVLCAKALTLATLWTAGYWLCFAITYGYTALYWDNTVAQNLLLSVALWWELGLWTVALMLLFSAWSAGNAGVLLGTGACFLASYLLGCFEKLGAWMPTRLMESHQLLYGLETVTDYRTACVVTAALCILCVVIAVTVFNKRQF